ncbi:MAG: DUF1329 domain-containing protein, partial [Gammaproteobacteria bacterium]|nr:DUF1329 domain-containing protein [Gammaproteobacteria bacterium]
SLFAGSVAAAELTEGTVIDASNIDQLQADTFEGHTVKELIPEKLAMWVRNYGLTIPLQHSAPIVVSPDYATATEKYASQATYNPATRTVDGFVAGVPFPEISPDDPDIAMKLIWNQYYVAPGAGDAQEVGNIGTYVVDGVKGIERTLTMRGGQIRMEGRVSGGPASLDDGTIHKKQMDFFVAPRDTAGLGVYQIKYNDGRLDSTWAYVKAARRIRRVSGGSWMDPTGALDFLNDDSFLLNSYPTWYPEYRYLGKRWILAIVHSKAPTGGDVNERYDFDNPPYWNPINHGWEPRQVHVIEAIPPVEHPYSRKVLYMEAEQPLFPHFYLGEFYDRKDEFWRMMWMGMLPKEMPDGKPGFAIATFGAVDFQREHASVLDMVPDDYVLNRPGVTPDDYQPGTLKAVAEGRIKFDR